MLKTKQILVTVLATVVSVVTVGSLSACGQPGALYLPTEPAAANRATLPQSLLPSILTTNPTPAPKPAAAASALTTP